jgi:SanA protein
MRKALVRKGVKPEDIFEDHAGFDTWATMARARSIFNVTDAVVVTQGFHMPRALFLAEEAGIRVSGLLADQHQWGYQGERSSIREIFSRVKAIWDTTVETPAMAGPKIPIQTADGRESWGPPPPAGTPPAGSPDTSAHSPRA